MVQGNVVADFEGQSQIVKRQFSLPVGCTVQTNAQSAAAIYWQPGLVVYLGPKTQLRLSGTAELPEIQLQQGSIRTVSRSAVIVQTSGTATQIGRGIARHSVDGSVSRVVCESGSVRTIAMHSVGNPAPGSIAANSTGQVQQVSTSSDSSSLNVAPGEQLVHDTVNGFVQTFPSLEQGVSGLSERLNVEQLQMETVAQASRAQRGGAVPTVPPLPEDSDKKPKTKPTEEEDEKIARGAKKIFRKLRQTTTRHAVSIICYRRNSTTFRNRMLTQTPEESTLRWLWGHPESTWLLATFHCRPQPAERADCSQTRTRQRTPAC